MLAPVRIKQGDFKGGSMSDTNGRDAMRRSLEKLGWNNNGSLPELDTFISEITPAA
jgi:hypothetical protein